MSLTRGTLTLFAGWAVQILALYCMTFWLGRSLGPKDYGTYYIVMSILLWIEIGAINGLPTAIQKFVSASQDEAYGILKKASQLQFVYVISLFIIFFLTAPIIGRLFNDPQLKGHLRIALWDVLVYGYFFIYMALQNGLRQFFRQAILIMVYSLSKLACVIIFVTIMHSVTGAFLANIAGSVVGLLLGIGFARSSLLNKKEVFFSGKILLRFAFPIALFSLLINLLLNVDLWFVKYFLGDIESGYYGSASAVARVPYFLFFALSATVLPTISKAISEQKEKLVQDTIWKAIRFIAMIVIPMSLLTVSYGHEIIVLLFDQRYLAAGEILRILMWGMSLLAFFFLLTTIINGDNRPGISLGLTMIALVLDVVLNIILIPIWGSVGAAIATTAALLVGSTVAAIFVVQRFRISIDIKTVLIIIGASLVIFLISQIVKVQGVALLFTVSLLMGLYGGLILLMKIVTIDEIVTLLRFRDRVK